VIRMRVVARGGLLCSTANDRPAMSTSLDIELKTTASLGAPAFFGKGFPVTFVLHCR
jgi:hypothetical protein